MSENNISLNGDEARILMAGLRTSSVAAPMAIAVNLYLKLNLISQVQPPSPQEASNERQ